MDKLANVLAEQFNCTVEYAKQHIPELMHDYCMYKGIVNLALAAVSLVVLAACVVMIVCIFKNCMKAKREGRDTLLFDYLGAISGVVPTGIGTAAIAVTPVAAVMSFIIMVSSSIGAIEALCFPNVYILEKVLEVI